VSRSQLAQLFLICTALVLVTFLRAGLIVVYPFFVLAFCYIFSFRLSAGVVTLILASILLLPLAFVFNDQPFLFNTILSLYIIYPILFLYLSNYKALRNDLDVPSLYKRFIKYLSVIMVYNNLIGLAQFVILHHDDAFTGFYGAHSIGPHGLGIINGFIFINYFVRFRHNPRWSILFLMLFFLCSFVMAFFGMALVLLFVSIALFYLFYQFKILNVIKFGTLVVFIMGVLFLASSKTFSYNYNILSNTVVMLGEGDFSTDSAMPRKLTVFYNYSKVFMDDIKLFLFGTGPGTFNSRTSFLLNGDYSTNVLVKLMGASQPEYALDNAYSLWNRNILSIQFNDGTRNQPFSSVIALLAEYGFIFALVLLIIVFQKIRGILRDLHNASRDATDPNERRGYLVNREFLIVAGIFTMLLLLSNNLIENTEILVFIIIMKLIEMTVPSQHLLSNIDSTDNEE